MFRDFLSNLAIDNAEQISLRYGEITASLNKKTEIQNQKHQIAYKLAHMVAGQRSKAFQIWICYISCQRESGMTIKMGNSRSF
jgi:hypothetical protein